MIGRLILVGFLSTTIGAKSDASVERPATRPSCDAPVVVVGHVPGHLDPILELRC
jgi:hypothetical protein